MTKLKTKGLQLIYTDGRKVVFYIHQGKNWTPFGYCVDHGTYYEIANWSSYTRVDKSTMVVTSDAKIVDNFSCVEGVTASIVNLKEVA